MIMPFRYERAWFPRDVMAGLELTTMLVPRTPKRPAFPASTVLVRPA